MGVLGLGPVELMIIVVIALVVFGPGRIAGLGGALGKTIREFKKETSESFNEAKGSTAGAEQAKAADGAADDKACAHCSSHSAAGDKICNECGASLA